MLLVQSAYCTPKVTSGQCVGSYCAVHVVRNLAQPQTICRKKLYCTCTREENVFMPVTTRSSSRLPRTESVSWLSPLGRAANADDKLVLPAKYSRRILMASSAMLLSCFSAMYNRLWDNALLALLVFSTSINYWRYPTKGPRRTFDMCCANGSLAYQVFFTSTYVTPAARACYLATCGAGGFFYGLARALNIGLGSQPGKRDLSLNISSACHVCLHMCGNIGNLILYDALGSNWFGWTESETKSGRAPDPALMEMQHIDLMHNESQVHNVQ